MSIDQVIALLASVGACLSAVATFLTVRQIAKQREASYRPELALSRVYVECSKDPIAQGPLPTHWVPKGKDGTSDLQTRSLLLPLRNVGLGTAKAVSVTWSFPFELVTSQVNELAQKSLSAAYFTFEKELLSLKSQEFGNSTSMWVNQKNTAVDYILPASVDREPTPLTLPHAYITLISSLYYFSAKNKTEGNFPDIPPLTAHMEYTDIGEGKHSAAFSIQFSLSALGGNGEFIYGYLEAKKSG
jgi:hypothetical protein